MTSVDRHDGSEEDTRPFEQWLLDSAREDELPRDVSGAWARFGASLAGASGLAASGGVAVRPSSRGALARVARSAAVKWLVLGALAGSALTFVWIGRAHYSRVGPVAPVNHTASIASASAAVSLPTLTPALAPSTTAAASPVVLAPQRSAPQAQRAPRSAASNLSAQVALLDAARAALSTRSFGAALSATDRYARLFPTGELRPDAEVVAIEALMASGNAPACRERAARFLARYPADPHAARVKVLAERAATASETHTE